MKQIVIILFLLIGNLGLGQEEASVQVIARPLPEKVMLRWAVDQPLAWKKANEYGFLIERATISRNGAAVVPIERQMLVANPLRPRPLQEWEALATQDQNAAVLAQALFGKNFETTVPGDKLGNIYAINDALEQRFTFALIAAEQNYEAAKLAGWAFEDKTVKEGEKYLYKISVAIPAESMDQIGEGTVYASSDIFEPLPKPIGLASIFKDSHVLLSWNFNLLQHLFTNYIVERSSDNTTFTPLNGVPIFSAQESQNGQQVSLFYTDSIPNNQTFYYRVKGRTAFGETGPGSEVVEGRSQADLGFVPRIYRKEMPTDNKVTLYWEFDEKGNELISGFELRRANTNKGPYGTVKKGIPVNDRETSYEGLKRSNYFRIVAMGKNGVESESYATLVQPVDSIPPKPPLGLSGVLDTTGIVRLRWDQNLEEDIRGYRVYRSYNTDTEFSEVTASTQFAETYNDTIPLANLNTKVYYKLVAEDQRYNKSEFSKVLVVDKPDVTPPSPPVLSKYEVTQEGIRINWIPSSSQDVVAHVVYRTTAGVRDMQWQKMFETANIQDTTFLDSKELEPNVYHITIVAKDSSGLESRPADPLVITWKGKTLEENDITFSGTVNRELRFISLSWKAKDQEVMEYRLYRGSTENDLKLYKTMKGTAKGYNDVELEINSNYVYGLQLVSRQGLQSEFIKIRLKY